jgi:DMSO reductase family type II enzyme chaperone
MKAAEVHAIRSPEVQLILGRSAVYELLSLAFAYPDSDWREDLAAVLGDLRDHESVTALGIEEALVDFASAFAASEPSEVAAEHNRLFAGEVACSAHETEYALDAFAKGRQLADIAGFYRAFGLEPGDTRGLPDFIATEFEFMSFITRKEAFAAVQGWDDRAEICANAQRSFLEAHLGRWLPAFARELAAIGGPFFRASAVLADAFVAAEVAHCGARPTPITGRIGRPEDAESFTCGLEQAPPDHDDATSEIIEMLPVQGWSPRAGGAPPEEDTTDASGGHP